MRMLFWSDLHLHNWSQFSTRLPSGRNSRLQDQLNVVSQVKKIVQERNVDVVFFVGDWYHSRTKIDVDVYSAGILAMRDLASTGVQVYLMRGNHDCYSRIGEVHSLEAYKSIVTVVDKPIVRVLNNGDKVTVAMFPYTAETDALKKQFQAIASSASQVDLVLMHQGIREGAVGPYGATVHSEMSLNDLPLDKVRYVIAGDYHKRQFLANGKFHYCGSPLQLTFGEAGEDKALSLIDTKDWKIESIPTEAPKFFSFANPTELVKAIRFEVVRLDYDFIRCYYKSENDIAPDIRMIESRIWFEQEHPETKALERIDPSVACDDRTIIEAWLDQTDHDGMSKQKLVELGLELLSGAVDE